MSQTQPVHVDSLEQEPQDSDPKTTKSRRPPNTAFRQQRLKAWQPILTPKTVLPLFFAVGIILAPIGGLLLYASSQVQEIVIDYTNCHEKAPNVSLSDSPPKFADITPGSNYHSYFKSTGSTTRQSPQWGNSTKVIKYDDQDTDINVCSLTFNIPNDVQPPILFYYRLTNFYQNHRRYVKSLDNDQLKGKPVSNGTINGGSCDPLQLNGTGFAYYPCGLIANSLFNDSFSDLTFLNPGGSKSNETWPMSRTGIAWGTDKELYSKTQYNWNQIAVPPNWYKRYPNGYTESNGPPNLSEDEAFQVWMRTAGLPAFSKLAMRNDKDVMKRGTYRVDIENNFPVDTYGGTKSIVISTRTVMGGKNPFLGIAYVVIGGICVVLGALFTVTHLIKPRKLGDHTYLTWNNDQPSTATATGRDA
ncbi:MAG: hypothetical protein M1814_005965 [Vezdaea aestivalis]|nr:MAG: hypothetical protein M1814_005965 [Vezdaea aestivalis]